MSSCDDLIQKFTQYSNIARKNERDIAEFVRYESKELKSWYNQLKLWEGTSVDVAPHHFLYIQRESDILNRITGQIIMSSQSLKAQFDEIMSDLKNCLNGEISVRYLKSRHK